MSKRNKTVFCIALSGIFALCMAVCVGFTAQFAMAKTTKVDMADLFSPSNFVLETMQYYDKDFNYSEKGVRIISQNPADKLHWKNSVVGAFEFAYVPERENGEYTAKKFDVIFTDVDASETFTVSIVHGEEMDARISFNGETAGIYYFKNAMREGTRIANASGRYTQFSAEKIKVTFDPSDMCVYVGNADGTQFLVWDMRKEENDGRNIDTTITSFGKYNVDFQISEYADDNGSLVLYSVNGTSLSGLEAEQSVPKTFADVSVDGVVGEKYEIPAVFGYDVVEGVIPAKVVVKDSDGDEVATSKNAFTPKKSGAYSIDVSATNQSGLTGIRTFVINVYDKAPAQALALEWNLQSEYVAGQSIYVPQGELSGGLLRYGTERARLTISRNGVTLNAYKNIPSGFTFTFSKQGEYKFEYLQGSDSQTFTVTVLSDGNRFTVDGLLSVYTKGSFMDFSNAVVYLNGESVPFEFNVDLPDGRKISNKKFEANLLGKYTVNAVATKDGQSYTFTKTFTVQDQTKNLFYGSTGVTISHGKSVFTGSDGIKINTIRDVLTEYAQEVDISKYVGQTETVDGITMVAEDAIPLIRFSVDPLTFQQSAVIQVSVYVTDAENPNNYIEIECLGWSKTHTYIRAGANGQTLAGVMNDGGGYFAPIGANGFLHQYPYGYLAQHSFTGDLDTGYVPSEGIMALYYDNETKQILSYYPGVSPSRKVKNQVVMDLDDPNFCIGEPWSGFSSDKVIVSFKVARFQNGAQNADLFVYAVDGKDLTGEYVVPDNEVKIAVDEKVVLEGLKQQSFKVPSFVATDCFGELITNTCVKAYYIDGGKRYDVSVVNDKFKTNRSGKYEIEYIATDKYGTVGRKVLTVTVKESLGGLSVAFADEISSDYKSATVGKETPLFAGELNVSNAFGNYTIEKTVYFMDNGNKVFFSSGDTFTPDKKGTYVAEYKIIEYVGRDATVSYQIEASFSDKPIIVSGLPHFAGFVRGNNYKIPDVYVIDYAVSAERKKADIYVDGKKIDDNIVNFEKVVEAKADSETVTNAIIQYRYGNVVLKKYTVPVKTVYKKTDRKIGSQTIESDKLLLERYFVNEGNISVLTGEQAMTLITQNKDAWMHFIHPVASSLLKVKFEAETNNGILTNNAKNVKSVFVRLTDAADASKTVVVQILVNDAEKTLTFKIGDENEVSIKGTLSDVNNNGVYFKYNDTDKTFYEVTTGKKLLSPKNYENGKTFDGFGKLVYVSFAVENKAADSPATICLSELNAQTFTHNNWDDTTAPMIYVNGEAGGLYDVGAQVKLPKATAYDVLSSISNGGARITVTLEVGIEKTYVKDVNGKELKDVPADVEYVISLSQAGNYKITYTAKDARKGEVQADYVLQVVPKVKPTITVTQSLPTKVALGTEVKVPTANVTFSEENKDNLNYVIAISPTNGFEVLKDGTFVATKKGVYKIRYFAMDVYGNYAMTEYKIVCE